MTDNSIWDNRIAVLELLTLSFAYPTQALADAVDSGEWIEAAKRCAEALGLDANALPDMEFNPSCSTLTALKAESTRLFIGAPFPAVMPYEGVNRSGDPFKAMLYVNKHAKQVQDFMIACGVGLAEGNDPMDHVATEIELLFHLALAAAGEPADIKLLDESALPGGSAAAAYRQFFAEHASQWLPDFADKVAQATELGFFRIAALLLGTFFLSSQDA